MHRLVMAKGADETPALPGGARNENKTANLCALLVCCLALVPCASRATSKKVPMVAKWGLFEHAFKSSVAYSNAVQEATLSVRFTSPLGETKQVWGFWDGGKVWRVRFSPDQPGRWTFKTTCSDIANKGLHEQTGELLCTAATGTSRFNRHGPVRVARDYRHLEHADGTPFFWLADTTWSGARMSEPKDWQFYAQTRAAQRFTAVQFSVAPGEDVKHASAFTGRERIAIAPDFFKRLDGKVETLSRAGLLSVISRAACEGAMDLPEEQGVLLARYVVARYGAEPVAWLVEIEGGNGEAAAWKRIGQAVFAQAAHAPVILCARGRQQVLDEFRQESWVDAFGYCPFADMTDDGLKEALAGPFAQEWNKEPMRPVIAFTPYENGASAHAQGRTRADDVREAAYWGLLMTPPAGLGYGGEGVVNWDKTSTKLAGEELPLWKRAMFMPAAKEMGHLAKFMESIEFWRLRPQPKFVAAQPGSTSARRYVAAAGTEAKDLTLIYVPEDRTLEIYLEALPASPSVTWLSPRLGENSPAVAVVGERSCQFPTPEPGDWLLVMKAGK